MDGPRAKKGLGQHWLHDSDALAAMCDAASVKKDDLVLEIGPGLGTLTDHLISRGAEIVALEFDNELADGLVEKYKDLPASTIFIQKGDIRTYDYGNMSDKYKIVANIPYYLTSHLIRNISETHNPPSIAVILVQKEVAMRVAAKPGDMSLLSVSAQFYWDVSLGQIVPAKLFTPPPKVDSQILVLNRKPKPLFSEVNEKDFFKIVKIGFAGRRKTLGNSLSGGLRISKEEIRELLDKCDINPELRAQALSLEQWYKIYKQVNT
jgi:16S rRNA (adenine1518-N6/adenine1519-N6)-dimethyltransferase